MEKQYIEENHFLSKISAASRIGWARDNFSKKLIMSTSFGIQSAVMLHMVTQKIPNIPIVFIDTGYLFEETYIFAKELTKTLNLNLYTYSSPILPIEQEKKYGKLWEQGLNGLNKYNYINKIEPMERAIKDLKAKAWLAGLRRQQSKTRKNLSILENQNQLVKIYPILDWDDHNIDKYLIDHNLPYHPLWYKGYVSVGDWHSSSPLKPNMNPEDTRFNGIKRECGLHLNFDQGGGI